MNPTKNPYADQIRAALIDHLGVAAAVELWSNYRQEEDRRVARAIKETCERDAAKAVVVNHANNRHSQK